MYSAALVLVFACAALAQGPANVLVIANQNSALSRSVSDYYVMRRRIPLAQVCRIRVTADETISREVYERQIKTPVSACLRAGGLQDRILYLVTTAGVPLRIEGAGEGLATDAAAVDSELTLVYTDMHGQGHALKGPLANPYFGLTRERFRHPYFPIYLVTRLTGYDFPDIKAMIDRGLAARNRGKFVIDLKSSGNEQGNDWLRAAARQLPPERVVLDESDKVLLRETGVIGFASWGSNDSNRKERHLGFAWLPGAIMTEFVSTNARTFRRPPETWGLGNWKDASTWFAGSPQTLTADAIHDGATGASGHVYEPCLTFTPRPDLLLPAYYQGRNLAESSYLSIPGLSWMNVVIGDPLCSLGKPVSPP